MEYLTDPMLKNQLKEFNDSKASLILINHQKAETILQHEEVLEYDAYKFISDSGILTKLRAINKKFKNFFFENHMKIE